MSASGNGKRRVVHDPLRVLTAVGELAAALDPGRPTRVTQRAFDRAAAASEAYDWLPPARRIAEDLRTSWAEVLALAQLPEANRTLASRNRDEDATWLSPDYAAFAVRLIAMRLGYATLTPAQYDAARRTVLAADESRWCHGGKLALPSANQVERVVGSWHRALQLAGIKRPRPVYGYQGPKPPTIVDTLERCYEAFGVEPTWSELETFARANGIMFPRRERGRPWASYLEEWKVARRAAGKPVPEGPPPTRERPDYSRPVTGAVRPRRAGWSQEACVAALVEYLRDLRPGERPTTRGYDAWRAIQQRRLPWASTFGRYGGWPAIRRRAWKRLRELERSGMPPTP